MKGRFKQSVFRYINSLFFFAAGTFMVVRFALWALDAIRDGKIAGAVFCFAFAIGGLLLGILSILIFRFNKDAFFAIENDQIKARCGWDQAVSVRISDITNAEIQGVHLKLYCNEQIIWIYNLGNAKEICEYILSRIRTSPIPPDIDSAKKCYDKFKKKYRRLLIATIVSCALIFLHFAWCVPLTGGRDLVAFSQIDEVIFTVFAFAEIVTVFFSFVLAKKTGKAYETFHWAKQTLLSANAFRQKDDSLDRYGYLIGRKYFDHYTYRIVIFSPEEQIFAYMLERFDDKTSSWEPCYEAAKGFELLSDLYEDIENTFSDVILVD